MIFDERFEVTHESIPYEETVDNNLTTNYDLSFELNKPTDINIITNAKSSIDRKTSCNWENDSANQMPDTHNDEELEIQK